MCARDEELWRLACLRFVTSYLLSPLCQMYEIYILYIGYYQSIRDKYFHYYLQV